MNRSLELLELFLLELLFAIIALALFMTLTGIWLHVVESFFYAIDL